MKFFKNGCKKGDGKFLLEMGLGGRGGGAGSQEWGSWFYNGGMENQVSLHS